MHERVDIDAYLAEFDGVAALTLEAQGAEGDDHHALLSLAAEAWRASRWNHGVNTGEVYTATVQLEADALEDCGVTWETWCSLALVYLERELALVRQAQRKLAAQPMAVAL